MDQETSMASPILRAPNDHHHQSSTQEEEPQPSIKGGWSSSIYIIGMEIAERFAFYGIWANMIMFLTEVLHIPTVSAAKQVYVWGGVTAILPIFGAFLADSYLGRYRTILYSALLYLLGLVTLTLAVAKIHHPYGKLLFSISLYLVAIGQGGYMPCVLPFGADQFDEDSPQARQAKDSFFNWCFFGLCLSATSAALIIVYIQENVGWAIGFAILAIAMAIALFLFLLGRKSYWKQAPIGSPLTQIVQVLVAAARKCHLHSVEENPKEGWPSLIMDVSQEARPLLRTNQLKFLDKATIVDEVDISCMTKNGWRLCSTTQVEELKLFLRLLPIWFCCLMYAVVFLQPTTFFTKQSSTMDRKISQSFILPPASLSVTVTLAAMVFVPIYDRIFVPIARRLTGIPSGLTMLQRIGVGMYLSVICMVIAALVETRRLRIVRELGLVDLPDAVVPMSMWWLLPQYLICGVSDVFTTVGLQEIFYDQMPDGMRSTGCAVYISIIGVGSFLSSAIVSVIEWTGLEWLTDNLNRAHLDYYYWILAVLSLFSLCVYLGVARCFVYKKTHDVLP